MQLFLDRRAEPNIANEYGITPLHSAVSKGQTDVVQLLLDRGAEPNMADHIGRTPLSWAQQEGHMDIVNILTKNGGTLQRITNPRK